MGWPAYLLFGATGGPSRGITSHFFPHRPFSTGQKGTELFPGKWKKKVWMSDVGVAAMMAVLVGWASKAGTMQVAALYGGPLMVVNAWLVLITWLQHTEVDVPHFEAENWSFIKGALHTIDRPYGKVLDFLHHRIGSTHVAHHVSYPPRHGSRIVFTLLGVSLSLWEAAAGSGCFWEPSGHTQRATPRLSWQRV